MKVTQAKKDLDTFPFPMSVSRAIPRPDNFTAKAWEVWELKPKLILSSKPSSPEDELDLKCEVATDGDLPTEVRRPRRGTQGRPVPDAQRTSFLVQAADAMGAAVVKAWRKKIKKAAKASTKAAEANAPPFNFCLVDMFGWAEDNYVEILSTLPVSRKLRPFEAPRPPRPPRRIPRRRARTLPLALALPFLRLGLL